VIPSLIERGNYRSASSLLNGLAWVARDSATARAQLGNALMGAGREEEAARAYARSGDLTPSADTFGVLARIELGLGFEKRALANIERAVEIAPDRTDVLSLAGEIEMSLGHRAAARSYFKRALGLNPNWEPAQRGLAETDSLGSSDDTSF
jgi:Flp pilus assembly protein TadD